MLHGTLNCSTERKLANILLPNLHPADERKNMLPAAENISILLVLISLIYGSDAVIPSDNYPCPSSCVFL
jgi:hypothetical protein